MNDAAENLARGFADEVHGHPEHLLRLVEPSEAFEQGRRAARELLAAIVWARSTGEVLDTSEVTKLLGVSRQALAKRLAAGTIIGLPGKNITIYPSWQFDLEQKRVRFEVLEILRVFAELMGSVDVRTVSTWAVSPQSEDLDGLSPAEWITKGNDRARVIEAARRAARRLGE